MSKLVTVGIPFYNNEKTLRHAINSTVKQTYSNLEIILIDDGSSDSSLEIATTFASVDNRIKIISDGVNRGLIARLNQIISIAQGEYIARMDADDLMDLNRIEEQVSFFSKHPETDVLTTGMISITTSYSPAGKRYCDTVTPDIYQVFKNGTGLLHPSMMTANRWIKANLYRSGFDRAEDRELFTRTLSTSTYYNLAKPLYFYMDIQNMTLEKYLRSYTSERKALWANWKGSISLTQFGFLLFRSYFKSVFIRIFFILGKQDSILMSRNNALNGEELEDIKKRILISMT